MRLVCKQEIITHREMSDHNKTNNASTIKLSPEIEERMRIMANLIIDRIFEDKKNNTLRFMQQVNKIEKTD